MTISFNIECEDCNKKYRIRYGMGNNFPQLASYQCYDCSRQIETGFDERGGERILRGAYSTTEQDRFDPEVQIINLHPEIPTRKGMENEPFHFQTFDIFKNLEQDNSDLLEFRRRQAIWSKFHSKWKELETPLRILSSKGEDQMTSICKMNLKELSNSFNEWISVYIEGKLEDNFDEICDEYNSLETSEIKNYVKNDLKLLKQINEFCSVYMKHHQHFQSTMLHLKYGWEITDDLIANINWDDIHKVYGDLFEIIGDLFIIPTMMNNIASGRSFDEFQTDGFTLEKYLKSDKANRAINFESNAKLAHFSKSYNSWLRNGTHHKNSYLNTETFEISLGTSKGGTIEKKIAIIDYIKNCNELFAMGIILCSLILNLRK